MAVGQLWWLIFVAVLACWCKTGSSLLLLNSVPFKWLRMLTKDPVGVIEVKAVLNAIGCMRPYWPQLKRGTQKGLHEVTRVSRSSWFNMFRVLRVGRRLPRRTLWIASAILLTSITRSTTSCSKLVENCSLHPLQEKVTFSRNVI